MNKVLASKLNNRIEVWRNKQVESKTGKEQKYTLEKKIWAEIRPTKGIVNQEEAETTSNTVKFKIRIRKTDIKTSDYIIFKASKYEIDYIIPCYKDNSFLDVYTSLKIG